MNKLGFNTMNVLCVVLRLLFGQNEKHSKGTGIKLI